jgi:hypothetical protein
MDAKDLYEMNVRFHGTEIGIGNWPQATSISPRTRISLKTHFMQVFSSSFFKDNVLKHLWFIIYT